MSVKSFVKSFTKMFGNIQTNSRGSNMNVNVNGTTINLSNIYGDLVVNDDGVFVNGERIVETDVSNKNVTIKIVGTVTGNINSKGSVSCDDVHGSVQASGSVQCDDVKGNVQAGGSINCSR